MYSDKISEAQDLVAKSRSELAENRIVYEAILQFYSDGALMETAVNDLNELLKSEKIEVYRTNAESFKDCVYNLLDEFPEITVSKGMLRYYEATSINWQECEKAEIAFGEALTQDTYCWQPDCWTVFERETSEPCALTLIVGF